MDEIIWGLMESEACHKFLINANEEKVAFLILHKYSPINPTKGYALFLNHVGLIKAFKREKDALERVKQIVENAYFPLRIYKVSKHGRNRRRPVLFAENTVERVNMEGAIGPHKVFEIDEWSHLP